MEKKILTQSLRELPESVAHFGLKADSVFCYRAFCVWMLIQAFMVSGGQVFTHRYVFPTISFVGNPVRKSWLSLQTTSFYINLAPFMHVFRARFEKASKALHLIRFNPFWDVSGSFGASFVFFGQAISAKGGYRFARA